MLLIQKHKPQFNSLNEAVKSAFQAARPPERLTVSQASEKYVRLVNPGSYTGPWKNSEAPYLVDVMDEFTNFQKKAVVFVGPAQSGKTSLNLNWMTYSVVCDPMNFTIIEKTRDDAREYSKGRVTDLIMNCPELKKRMGRSRSDDNVFDKKFKGMTVNFRHPTKNSLSGKPIPRLAISDYDRIPLSVDGEGNAFSLALGRGTSFGHFAMVFAESSPGHDIIDPRWTNTTPHEAPPCSGILSHYNEGDRRRWYWICVDCGEAFEPEFKLLKWPEGLLPWQAGQACWLECPYCKSKYKHEPEGNRPGKFGLNAKGFWLTEGQTFDKTTGEIIGEPRQSSISSFWLKGPAARFKTWSAMVESWLSANEIFARTHDDEPLKATVNTEQGMPYLSKFLESDRIPEQLMEQALQLGNQVIPPDVRFLVASTDVQKSRFVVQVHGVSEGGDVTIIDRFDIKFSLDLLEDVEIEGQRRRVRPHSEPKDWKLLLREVMLRTYPIMNQPERRMAIRGLICDSGGYGFKGSVTSNAYSFWRWIRTGPRDADIDFDEWKNEWTPGLVSRFGLFKGSTSIDARTRITWPDSRKKDKLTGARGEIPLLLANTNLMKDKLSGMIDNQTPKTGMIRYPKWLPMSFYKELCVETRLPDGKWERPGNYANEAWDLLVMALSMMIEPHYEINVEKINWNDPPVWALPQETNELVFWEDDEKNPIVHPKKEELPSFEELGKNLG